MRTLVCVMAVGAFGASAAWLSSAHADTVVTTEPPPAVVTTAPRQQTVVSADTARSTGPNTGLITSGFITFGVPYVTSIIVASQSNHDGDKNLYVPVAGPWIDLANRGGCNGVEQPTCATETGYKVLLVADGILQTVGAVEVLAGLLIPTRQTTVVAAAKPSVHVAPTPIAGGGAGIAAVGRF